MSHVCVVSADDTLNSVTIKSKLYDFTTIKKNEDMTYDWELKGHELKQYNNDITHIKKPKLRIHNTSSLTRIQSETAVDPTSKMEEIYLKDNVYIINKNSLENIQTRLYTSYAIFYVAKNLVETDRDITIITTDSKTTGTGFSANMQTGLVTILSNVKRVINKNDTIQTIEGNQMIYNTNNDKWIVKNKAASTIKDKISKKVTTTFNIK